MSDQNSVKISELLKKEPRYELGENGNKILVERALQNTDTFIVEDEENTKSVTFENIIMSAIYDDEQPNIYRIYSSAKVNSLIQKVNKDIAEVRAINTTYDRIVGYYESTVENINNLKSEFEEKLKNKLSIAAATSKFDSKRDINVKIKASDLDTSSNDVKIKKENLSQEVIDMMTGNAEITVSASAPDGGWMGDDIADRTIARNNLSDTYQFVENVTKGDINLLTKDGFYLLGYKVEGLPKMSDDDNEPRIMRVDRISTDYITQTVYYTSNVDERPIYIRRGKVSTIYLTEFKEIHEISPSYKIGRDMLKEEFNNNGIIDSGSIFSYTDEGQYYAQNTVNDLPSQDDYLVTVNKHGEEYLYTAELISLNTCKVYHAKSYVVEGKTKQTQWYTIINSDKSKFDKKNVIVYGDDAFYGAGADNILTDSINAILSDKYGMNINSDYAKIGATISNYDKDSLQQFSVVTQIKESEEALKINEYAIILAGTHDWAENANNLGLNDSNDTMNINTFRGALVSCISSILTTNPNIKLLLCTPFYRGRLNSVEDGKDADNFMVNDKYLRDFVDVMVDVADYYHIPLLNLYSTSGINKFTESAYLSDGLLLNNNGHQLIADKIYNAMEFYF